MTENEKIGHLLRRLGLGAGSEEIAHYKSLGVDGTLEKLTQDKPAPSLSLADRWACYTNEAGNIRPSAISMRAYWTMRMACTDQPLRERLAFFWHNHLPVSGTVVGPYEMDDYLCRLLNSTHLPFREVLHALAMSPAMLRFLDAAGSYPLDPNENFARELLELFTVGRDHVTEVDVKTLSVLFAGMGIQHAFPYVDDVQKYLRSAKEKNVPLVDTTLPSGKPNPSKINLRGRAVRADRDECLNLLSTDKAAVERLIRKVWLAFVGTSEPSATELASLANVLKERDYKVHLLLRHIAKQPYFWDASCVRRMPKSPIDFTVSLIRQLKILPRSVEGNPFVFSRPALSKCLVFAVDMENQGLSLLHPEDVSGWKGGNTWISSSVSVARIQMIRNLFLTGWADPYLEELCSTCRKASVAVAIERITGDLDAEPSELLVSSLGAILNGLGSTDRAFADIFQARTTMVRVGQAITASPDFNFA